jgi:hypothetical protein
VVLAPTDALTLERALSRVAESVRLIDGSGSDRPDVEVVAQRVGSGSSGASDGVLATIPACPLEQLGDPHFRARHGLRYACMSGAMANGIGSVEIVEAMARAGFLGVFGSAGLSIASNEAWETGFRSG